MESKLTDITLTIHDSPNVMITQSDVLQTAAAEGVKVEQEERIGDLTLLKLEGKDGTYVFEEGKDLNRSAHVTMDFNEARAEARVIEATNMTNGQNRVIRRSVQMYGGSKPKAARLEEKSPKEKPTAAPKGRMAELVKQTHHSPNAQINESEILRQAQAEGLQIDRHWKGVGRESRLTFLSLRDLPGTFVFQSNGSMATHLGLNFYEATNTLHNKIEREEKIGAREAHIRLITHSVEQEWRQQTRAHAHTQSRSAERSR